MHPNRIQGRGAKLRSRVARRLMCGIAAALPLAAAAVPASAETRGYVISWFATATYNLDFKSSCPQDKNGGGLNLKIRELKDIGYSDQEAHDIVNNSVVNLGEDVNRRIETRARVNGKPASVFNYPEAVPDPNIETVSGKFAYGFDLDGKTGPQDFEDPDTHQKIDNQLWRAVGCTESFRATPPAMPYPEELSWNTMIDSAPAWSLQILGDDLNKDGKVTLTLDRVFQHLERDATGNILSDSTYVIDPSPRSHNVLQGEIKDGVLTIKPADVYLEGEMPYYAEIALQNTHMRIKSIADGKLLGYWGGYLDWKKFIYMYTSRPANGADSIGIYHALKKMADANPDPKTGRNRFISTAFRMEAVPAYLAKQDGKILASPAPHESHGTADKAADAGSAKGSARK